jgi:hypothetical protein
MSADRGACRQVRRNGCTGAASRHDCFGFEGDEKDGESMNGSLIDEFAKGVAERSGSRRGVLRLVAGGVAAALPSMMASGADAGKKARAFCRSQGGIPVKGACRCAVTFQSNDVGMFRCNGNPACSCTKSAEGRTVCASDTANSFGCSSARECGQPGDVCTVTPLFPDSGAKCKTAATCPDRHGCVKGRCQFTICSAPCPLG